MAAAASPPLLALWADAREIYALLRGDGPPSLVSTEIEDGSYPALSPARPAAALVRADGARSLGPCRDRRHRWACPGSTTGAGATARRWRRVRRRPRGRSRRSSRSPRISTRSRWVRSAAASSLPRICALGVRGETVVRLEARLGYAHKGTLALIRGKSPRAAARFAARLAGEATVAHSVAFARATEAALGCEVPPRALALRDIMAEVERIAGHLDALSAVAEAAGTSVLAERFAWHGEAIRRAADVAFGHRLMMDCVIPGGVAADIAPGGSEFDRPCAVRPCVGVAGAAAG